MTLIVPTVGRIVWYVDPRAGLDAQPYAAIISYVINDRLVNLGIFDPHGYQFGLRNVTLVQEGDAKPETPYARWMPYQLGQAAKTEAAQAALQQGYTVVPEPKP